MHKTSVENLFFNYLPTIHEIHPLFVSITTDDLETEERVYILIEVIIKSP